MDPLNLIQYTIAGLMPLIAVGSTGAYFVHKKIFTYSTVEKLSTSYSNYFNPVFIFFNISGSINPSKFYEIWPLLLIPTAMILLGNFLSFIHSQIFRQGSHISKLITCIITFSNMGNIPVVLMKGMCSSYGPLRNYTEKCSEVNSYVAIQMLTYHVILWSYGYSLIELAKEEARQHQTIEDIESSDEISDLKPQKKYKFSIGANILRNLKLPVPMACMAGLVFGLMGPLKEVIFEKNSILFAFTDSWLNIGFAGVVIGQISLGANLVILSGRDRCLTTGYVGSVVLFKNIIMPVLVFFMIYSLWVADIFAGNLVMAYVVFISYCCPTALVIIIITQIHAYGNQEAAFLMFWIYAFSLPSIVVATYVFFLVF